MAAKPRVAVVLGDPRLPYSYATEGVFGAEELQAAEHLREALESLPDYEFVYLDDHANLLDALRDLRPELALNLCDTGIRNDWQRTQNVPALLEVLEIPYTGASPSGIVLSDDKALVSAAAALRGIPVPAQTFIDLSASQPRLPEVYPALLKPNVGQGSFGVTANSVVHDDAEARAQLEWLREQLEVPEVLAQEYLPGDEYTLGVVGNPGRDFTLLPPLKVDFSALDPSLPRILTYGSKADPESPYWQALTFAPASLSDETRRALARHCEVLFGRMGLHDYARFDFRDGVDGKPRLIDANCNPTWYREGKMAIMASWAGHDYATFLGMILQSAFRRHGMG